MDALSTVRSFNREVTRRVGALQDGYLDRGRPLGEARLLFEIGADGPKGETVAALRTRLGLDSGYLSRLLRSLERQGLVSVERAPGDGRRRFVMLSADGRRERGRYERLSDALARDILAPFDAMRQARLVAAMAEVDRLLKAARIAVTQEAPSTPDAHHCLASYFRELASRFDGGFEPGRSIPAEAAAMTAPVGAFFVARLDGRPVGCGGLKIDRKSAIGEVKRMWTADAMRGLGVARSILSAIEAGARRAGLGRLRLETNQALLEAQSLYRSQGFQEVAAFNAEPYAHHWFEKRLD